MKQLKVKSEKLEVISEKLKMKSEKLKVKSGKLKVKSEKLEVISGKLKVNSETLKGQIKELERTNKQSVFHFSFFIFHLKGALIFIFSLLTFHSVSGQELEVLINEGLANNPKIQIFELRYQVAREKVNEAKVIPNTQIGVGYFVSEPETRTGAQRFKVSAKQMLPSFGSITARENYASSLLMLFMKMLLL